MTNYHEENRKSWNAATKQHHSHKPDLIEQYKNGWNNLYQHIFHISRWGIHINYEDLPRNFETYSEKDQETIRKIMSNLKHET